MTRTTTILALLILGACAPDDDNAPPPPESGTDSDPTEASLTDYDPDTTAGDQCEGWGIYQCLGWRAGVYQNNGAGPGQFFNLPPDSTNAFECLHLIEVAMPLNSSAAQIEARCTEECEAENPGWPASYGNWQFDHNECVFASNGNNGYLLSENSGIASCPYVDEVNPGSIDGTPPIVQMPSSRYSRPALPDDCAPVSCAGWNPNSKITYSYNTSTKTHTTGITAGHLSELYWDDFELLYACDDARWEQNYVGGVEKWSMTQLVAGDFLYRMGFRNGDYEVTIKRAGSTSYPTYSLNGYANIQTAFDALHTYHSWTIKFKRPKSTSPYYDIHTINLTG